LYNSEKATLANAEDFVDSNVHSDTEENDLCNMMFEPEIVQVYICGKTLWVF
jgi:hypothetical protein